jgi:hypothetical protein
MSTPQRTPARTPLTVDRATADVLRVQAKNILVFNHEIFEDFLDFGPEAQHALSMRFRDAFDVIDIVGWDPDSPEAKADTFEIEMTEDLAQQLAHRRYDLGLTNINRLDKVGAENPIPQDVLAEITIDRLAAGALDRLISAYTIADTRKQR